jgi:hypothetical protein
MVELTESTTTNDQNDPNSLLSWCLARGVIAPKLRIAGTGVHRGLIAIETIYPSETLLTIPSTLLISRSRCLCDSLLEHVYREQARLFDHQEDAVLAVFLAFHKVILAEKSPWYVYLQSLPEIDVLSDWDTIELDELQDIALKDIARERQNESTLLAKSIVTRLCSTYPKLFPSEVFTERLFLWAYKNVASRGFGSRVDEVQLVPLADMFNHSNESRTKYELLSVFSKKNRIESESLSNMESTENVSVDASLILNDKNISCVTSTIDKEVCDHHHHHSIIKQNNETHDPTPSSMETIFRMYSTSSSLGYAAGEMVTFSYGRRDNSHLLMEYGFALDKNEHETLVLTRPPIQTLSFEAKEILTSEQYVCGPFNLVFGRIDGHLLSYFRAIALSQDSENFNKWARGDIRSLNHPFSSKGEQCALALYSNYLMDFLTTAFPTTIEQDEAKQKEVSNVSGSRQVSNVSGSRLLLALQYRLEKKRLLLKHIQMSRARLEELTIALGSYKTSSLALDSLPTLFGTRSKSEGKDVSFDTQEEEGDDISGFKLSDFSEKSSSSEE